uniref:Uncharacterized protein n=1 Tax=Vombatus ursinus TaxID=29139 RepID=A0A4X2LFR5_VOMUR
MEGEKMSALLSGFLFSSLAFQHFNCKTDTEGFLLGEMRETSKNNIMDSELSDVEVVYTVGESILCVICVCNQ